MTALDLVQARRLMELSQGLPDIFVALIDGPVALNLPDFAAANIREVPGKLAGTCSRADTLACMHGTFVTGILAARRGSAAPAICPGCTLLLRPIFAETADGNGFMPSATPEELAEAILDVVDAGARIINLSAAVIHSSPKSEHTLAEALDYSAQRGVLTVAAAGNQGAVGSTAITRHPAVIPVAACDLQGKPINDSNFGSTIGRRGLMAPGLGVTSLGPDGQARVFSGTSAAAPFVTGTVALLWSEFPSVTAAQIKLSVTQLPNTARRSIIPPVLNASAAYVTISRGNQRQCDWNES